MLGDWFQAAINLAEAPRFWRIRESVQAFLLPGIEPSAGGIAVNAENLGELLESKPFGRQQDCVGTLPLTMGFGVVMHSF